MAYTPIPKGTDPWDVQVNGAFTDQDNRITTNANDIAAIQVVDGQQWNEITINRNNIAALRGGSGGVPLDYGLLNWSYDPSQVISNVTPASGTVVMTKMYLAAGTASAVGVNIGAAGVTLTAGQNFMGLYDQSGNRIGVTADQSSNWTSIGYKQMNLVAPATLPTSGYYYVAFLSNGATPASLTRASNVNVSFVNLNLTNDTARYATGPTGQSTLPTTVTMSARTPIAQTYWMTVA